MRYPSNILVIKSCRTGLFCDALDRLEKLFPGASLSCVLLHKMQGEREYADRIDGSFVLRARYDTYSARAVSRELARDIRGGAFDLAVMVYANGDGGGYENVHAFARALPVPQRAYINGVLAFGFLPEPGTRTERLLERITSYREWGIDMLYGICAVPLVELKARKGVRPRPCE